MNRPLMALTVGMSVAAGWAAEPHLPEGWTAERRGRGWRMALTVEPAGTGVPEAVLAIGYPGSTESTAGDYAQVSRTLSLPVAARYALSFAWQDDFTGPTAGHHIAQVLVDDSVVWEADVAGGGLDPQAVRVDVTARCAGRRDVVLRLRLHERQRVTNFPVSLRWRAVQFHADEQPLSLLTAPQLPPYEHLPDDPPLAGLPPLDQAWLRSAVVLQPWGATQHTALTESPEVPRRLATDYGFNAVIVLPPGAHNAITKAPHHLSEDQFDAGVAAYRAAGFRLILYSSIMHCGHAPEWQTGVLTREHPEWSQRDREGHPITLYGHDWLCPSTPALEYTLRYTAAQVERYRPDAVMLDNNEFQVAKAGPTCYCPACQEGFRRYLLERFGEAGVRRLFQTAPADLLIPTEAGALFNLWIHWRNRLWAQSTETFRRRLREVSPSIALFANTQYLYRDWVLATDLQYEHEDMLLSESRGLTGAGMSDKLLLGRALAGGRPLWNYIGTFEEKDLSRLRAPEVIAEIVAASLAHLANPWIVYYGFSEANQASLAMLTRLMHWRAANPGLFAGLRPAAPVAVVVSPSSRNLFGSPLIPPCLSAFRQRGIPVTALSERHLRLASLADVQVLALPGVRCLSPASATAVAAWVRAGGTLLCSPDSGWYDEAGRLRPESTLAQALGLPLRAGESHRVGAGRVLAGEVSGGAALAALREQVWWTGTGGESPWEIVPYRAADGRLVVHLNRYSAATAAAGELLVPLPAAAAAATVRLASPFASPTSVAAGGPASGRLRIPLDGALRYAVVEVGPESVPPAPPKDSPVNGR